MSAPKHPIPVRGRAIKIQDNSMAPYLHENDTLWVEEEPDRPLEVGQLVLAENRKTGMLMVKRILPGGEIKGDDTRILDESQREDMKILGVITGRTTREDSPHWVPYSSSMIVGAHRVQALLSFLNQRQLSGVSRIAGSALSLMGRALRKVEEKLL